MKKRSKPIRLSEHARQQLRFRGAKEEQVIEEIQTEIWQTAELGRLECSKDFVFSSEWNKKYYGTTKVRPIFVDEPMKS